MSKKLCKFLLILTFVGLLSDGWPSRAQEIYVNGVRQSVQSGKRTYSLVDVEIRSNGSIHIISPSRELQREKDTRGEVGRESGSERAVESLVDGASPAAGNPVTENSTRVVGAAVETPPPSGIGNTVDSTGLVELKRGAKCQGRYWLAIQAVDPSKPAFSVDVALNGRAAGTYGSSEPQVKEVTDMLRQGENVAALDFRAASGAAEISGNASGGAMRVILAPGRESMESGEIVLAYPIISLEQQAPESREIRFVLPPPSRDGGR